MITVPGYAVAGGAPNEPSPPLAAGQEQDAVPMIDNPPTFDSLPRVMRGDAWQARLAQISLVAEFFDGQLADGSIEIRHSGSGARLARIVGERQTLVPAKPQSNEAPVLLLLVLKGRGTLACGSRAIDLADDDLAVMGMEMPWRMHWRSDFDVILLQLPRAPLASRLGRSAPDAPVVLGHTFAALAARPVLRMLAGKVGQLEQADLTAGELAVTELVASALLVESRTPNGSMTEVQTAHFRRVAAAIDANLSDPDLTPADIARKEGMSVRYLQRLFQLRDDSFSGYLRHQRLERCRADLIDPNHALESIAAIGLRWGFRDQAYFSRAFSAAFGMSPTELRRSVAASDGDYHLRGLPPGHANMRDAKAAALKALASQPAAREGPTAVSDNRYHLPANAQTVHWGYLSRTLPPALFVEPGATVTIETLTQHCGDDWERMVAGDAGAESVFAWTPDHKGVDRRGAGPMNASVFGRGAGEGFGVHICTGPIHVRGAEPGDILEVEFLEIAPRPSGNPAYAGKAFASNASAWWGYQYNDLLDHPERRETITIFEIDLEKPNVARPLYNYRWTPQIDPYGTVHKTMDYPGIPVDHGSVEKNAEALAGIEIPARMHFGFIGVAPREADIVDSIPPGYFGGNIDNWRVGEGARIFLPVSVEGALLSIGDGHFAQADGEINGTGLECSLTSDIRIRLHKADAPEHRYLEGLKTPLIETPDSWVIQSFSFPNYLRDLGRNAQAEVYQRSTVDLALRSAFRQARRFLMDTYDLEEDEALALMSLAVDFGVTQVADGNFGVHATVRKSVFRDRKPRS